MDEKSNFAMKYVIAENKDSSIRQCTSKKQWEEQSPLRKAPPLESLMIVLEFDSDSYDKAMQTFYDFYNYGQYKPIPN
jgi:hypothetical protein